MDNYHVRYRSCQILKLLCDKLVGVALEDEICLNLQNAMQERIRVNQIS